MQGARIKRNSFFAFLSQIIRLLANVVVFMGIARLYGPVEFGQFAAAHTLSAIFIVLADFGFDILLTSEIAHQRIRATELSRTYFSMKLLFAAVASILMLVAAYFQQTSESTRSLMFLFSAYVFFGAMTNFFFALFKSFEQLHHETRISFVMNSVLLVAVGTLGFVHASVFSIAVAFIVSRIIGLAIALPIAAKLVSWRPFQFTFATKEEVFQISIFGLHALFTILVWSQDTILLSLWRSDHEVGAYQAVIKIVSLVMILSDISFYSLLPVLSRLHATDRDAWLRVGRLLHKTLLFLGLPISFIMIVFPDQIISAIYGLGKYGESVPVLQLFGWIVFVRYFFEASGMMLTSSRRQYYRMIVLMVAVVMNFSLNVVAIPRFGIGGASIVSLITHVIIGLGYALGALRDVNGWLIETRNYLPVSLAMVFGIWLWGHPLPLLYCGPLIVGSLLAAAYFVGYSKSERLAVFSLNRQVFTSSAI